MVTQVSSANNLGSEDILSSRESNCLKYRSGSGSRLFKNLGSGSVRVQWHQNLKVRFGIIKTKFLTFRLSLGSLNPNFKSSGSVRVQDHKTVHKATGKPRFLFMSRSYTFRFRLCPELQQNAIANRLDTEYQRESIV